MKSKTDKSVEKKTETHKKANRYLFFTTKEQPLSFKNIIHCNKNNNFA
jgi:hypothetical protein